jgi:hypothetical protein
MVFTRTWKHRIGCVPAACGVSTVTITRPDLFRFSACISGVTAYIHAQYVVTDESIVNRSSWCEFFTMKVTPKVKLLYFLSTASSDFHMTKAAVVSFQRSLILNLDGDHRGSFV